MNTTKIKTLVGELNEIIMEEGAEKRLAMDYWFNDIDNPERPAYTGSNLKEYQDFEPKKLPGVQFKRMEGYHGHYEISEAITRLENLIEELTVTGSRGYMATYYVVEKHLGVHRDEVNIRYSSDYQWAMAIHAH